MKGKHGSMFVVKRWRYQAALSRFNSYRGGSSADGWFGPLLGDGVVVDCDGAVVHGGGTSTLSVSVPVIAKLLISSPVLAFELVCRLLDTPVACATD